MIEVQSRAPHDPWNVFSALPDPLLVLHFVSCKALRQAFDAHEPNHNTEFENDENTEP